MGIKTTIEKTADPERMIKQLKYSEELDHIRITFHWPTDIEQVYIFKTDDAFDIHTARFEHARMYTLQEYKRKAGFINPKEPGEHTYYIIPFERKNGEDICYVPTDAGNRIVCHAGQIIIRFSLKEKKTWLSNDKRHEIILFSAQSVAADTVCYVKKEHTYPADAHDGTMYLVSEPLIAGRETRLLIKTGKSEYLRLFIKNPAQMKLYSLQMM